VKRDESEYPDAAPGKGLVIYEPSLQSPFQKYSYGFCTIIAWALWAYLWLPLISLIGWLFGIRVFYRHMVELGGWIWFMEMLAFYLAVIGSISGALLLWALYNQTRFRGKDRRGARAPATDAEMEAFFGIDLGTLRRAQRSRRMTILFDEDSQILEIRADNGMEVAPPPRNQTRQPDPVSTEEDQ